MFLKMLRDCLRKVLISLQGGLTGRFFFFCIALMGKITAGYPAKAEVRHPPYQLFKWNGPKTLVYFMSHFVYKFSFRFLFIHYLALMAE